MAKVRVLLVEDDPVLRGLILEELRIPDCALQAAVDGGEGLIVALKWRPDLIITDVMMRGMDGWMLVKQLRARSDFALVPVIFLTALGSDEDRLHGFRLGADDYLVKPFQMEELELRAARALHWRREAIDTSQLVEIAAADPIGGVFGSLQQLGLPTLLSMLDIEGKSGSLVLRRKRQTGRIVLRKGRVVAARIDGSPARGEEAVFELLGWSDGRFELSSADEEVEPEMAVETTHLLLEAARRQDESRRE